MGLKSLHAANILHRDLKPQNLLLTVADLDKTVVKIADFGLAREIAPQGMAETMCGSPLYMAIEVLEGQKYNAKADLWAVGCILYEMFTGRTPFTAMSVPELINNIKCKHVDYNMKIPPDAANLISKLLQRNPAARIDVEQFIKHKYVQEAIAVYGPKTPAPTISASQQVSAPPPPLVIQKIEVPRVVQEDNIVSEVKPVPLAPTPEPPIVHQVPAEPVKQGIPVVKEEAIPQPIVNQPSVAVAAVQTVQTPPKPIEASAPSEALVRATSPPSMLLHSPPKPQTKPFNDNLLPNVKESYVLIDDKDAEKSIKNAAKDMNQSIVNLVQITRNGHVCFPTVIFDFSKFKCDPQNAELTSFLENNAKQAWAIGEAAQLHSLVNKRPQAFALFIQALQLLLNTFTRVKSEVKYYCERTKAGVMWLRVTYADFMERVEALSNQLQPRQTMIAHATLSEYALQQLQLKNSVCVEKVLFSYAIKLAKQAAFEEYMKEDSQTMFMRAKLVLEYLLWHCSAVLADDHDKKVLSAHIDLISKRMALTQK